VCDTVGLAKPEVLLWWCRLLFRTAFYFGYGPFRTLWIKNGYDPRKDPESRMYQMMDFRIPRAVRENGHAPERPQKDPEWRDICSFRVAPQKKFSHLQLHDLQDDFIQEQIRKPAERSSCSVSLCFKTLPQVSFLQSLGKMPRSNWGKRSQTECSHSWQPKNFNSSDNSWSWIVSWRQPKVG
jgi:hypothetical protein